MFTVKEFCEFVKISRATYFRMQCDGSGPKSTTIGKSAVRIKQADALAWLDQQPTVGAHRLKADSFQQVEQARLAVLVDADLPDDAELGTTAAAAFLARSVKTLAMWRSTGKGGPPYRKRGRVTYRVGDLRAFVGGKLRTSTAAGASLGPTAMAPGRLHTVKPGAKKKAPAKRDDVPRLFEPPPKSRKRTTPRP